jgi:hypothetical protein
MICIDRLNRFVVAISVLGFAFSASATEKLPSDAQKIVASSKAEISELELETEEARKASYVKLVSQLKAIQAELTMQILLDEAVAVRDLLRGQEHVSSDTERLIDLRRKVDVMPPAAKKAINDYLEIDTKVSKHLAEQIAESKSSRTAKLTLLFEKYTKAGDLESAIAIRDELGGGELKSSPQNISEEPALGNDLTKARDLHREFCAAASQDFQERIDPIITRMLSDLQADLMAKTKANKLDEAIKSRDFIKLLDSQQNAIARFGLAFQQRRYLEGTVLRIVEETLEKCSEIERGYLRRIKTINSQLATIVEPELRSALTSEELSIAKELLKEFHMLQSRLTEFNQGIASQVPFDDDAAKVIQSFEAETQKRVADYDQKESTIRKALVAKLGAAIEGSEATDNEKAALKNACEFANADFSLGLQGMLLYRVPESMTTLGKEAIDDYTKVVKQLLIERQEAQDNAVRELAEKLQPLVIQCVSEDRYLEAYRVRDYQANHQTAFRPLTIKVTNSAYSDYLTDAKLIDVRGKNSFLVQFNVSHEEWVPRSRIRYAPDDPIHVADLRVREEPEGPGVPVGDETKLEPGQKAFKLFGSAWWLVTITELTPSGVVIRWGARGKGGDEVVQRAALRVME